LLKTPINNQQHYVVQLTPVGAFSGFDVGSQELSTFLTALSDEGFVFDPESNVDFFDLITVGTAVNPISDGAAPIFYNGNQFMIDASAKTPVNYVSYFGAKMYAYYHNKELPTNA
jgi:formylglycine-generating enzyme required for sulfatase activity